MQPRPGLLLLLLTLLLAALPATARELYMRGYYVGLCPAPEHGPLLKSWRHAQALASTDAKSFVVCGSGPSMEPLYPSGTILVVREVPFSTLKAGSAVLYYNRAGKPVMHLLVAHTESGWRVAGLNNPSPDPDALNETNFAGIVVRAFVPEDAPSAPRVVRIAYRVSGNR